MLTIEQKTYRTLRRQLLTGAWQPGHRLSALAIAKQIGVSPTPVTQAIRRLKSEGFVEVVPHMGAFVRRPRLRELAELFDLRRALEVFAVRQASRRITDEGLGRLEARITAWAEGIEARTGGREQDPDLIAQAFESDLFFHMIVMEIAGNRKAIQVFHDCHLLTRVFGAQPVAADAESLRMERQDLADHRTILDALRRRRGGEAARAMDHHLRRGKRTLLQTVKRSRAAGEPAEPAPWSSGVAAALARAESYQFARAT